ncbi:MAG TPA: lytic murein transglycosylase [Solirubrobacterales bacterium]
MGRIRNTLAVAAVGAALAAPAASAAETTAPLPATTAIAPPQPVSSTAGGTVKQGDTLAAPTSAPAGTQVTGGTSADGAKTEQETAPTEEAVAPTETGAAPTPAPSESFPIPSIPSSTCASTGVPPVLVPIYQRAADAYGLGPQGPSVLAGINEVETAFGTNLNISSAGAEGWMQFMPETWNGYGVDANGDGVKDPFNPEDAIFAAAAYLSANGMPQDTYGAIFAYNHADWYVAEVLSNAACYAPEVGGSAITEASLKPQHQVLTCKTGSGWNGEIPAPYMSAFQSAAARYDLGRRGVWALAAIARLESSFGAGMTKAELRSSGPLGLEPSEWKHFGVDGDDDGHIRHGDPADSAATLARLIWSRGSLRAGIFSHNQAEWYVQEVLDQAEEMEGNCKVTYAAWSYAPLGGLGPGPTGETSTLVDNLANPPQDAPPAVKAAVNAANSISTTPYIWGGGHGSWYSSGYDCSGAVSFALYGGGLLDTPLTSGDLMNYGEPGPGRWITIYASPTHTYAEIAGLRWDTVGDASGTGPRWHVEPPYPEGFVVRHPPGY